MTEAADARDPFVMLPEWLMARTDVSDGAKMLWAYLRDRERRYGVGQVYPSRETIARAIGTNVDGYKLRSRQLQAAGLLHVDTKAGAYGQNAFRTLEPTPEGRGENTPTRSENTPTRGEISPKVGGETHRRSGGKPPAIQKKNQTNRQTTTPTSGHPKPNEVRAALERGFKAIAAIGIPGSTNPSRGQLGRLADEAFGERPGDPIGALEELGAALARCRVDDPWRLLLSKSGGFALLPVGATTGAPDPARTMRTELLADLRAAEIEAEEHHDPETRRRARERRDALREQIERMNREAA